MSENNNNSNDNNNIVINNNNNNNNKELNERDFGQFVFSIDDFKINISGSISDIMMQMSPPAVDGFNESWFRGENNFKLFALIIR